MWALIRLQIFEIYKTNNSGIFQLVAQVIVEVLCHTFLLYKPEKEKNNYNHDNPTIAVQKKKPAIFCESW